MSGSESASAAIQKQKKRNILWLSISFAFVYFGTHVNGISLTRYQHIQKLCGISLWLIHMSSFMHRKCGIHVSRYSLHNGGSLQLCYSRCSLLHEERGGQLGSVWICNDVVRYRFLFRVASSFSNSPTTLQQ